MLPALPTEDRAVPSTELKGLRKSKVLFGSYGVAVATRTLTYGGVAPSVKGFIGSYGVAA